MPYGASKTKTAKILRRNTNVSPGRFARLMVENDGFAADFATNLPQILRHLANMCMLPPDPPDPQHLITCRRLSFRETIIAS